MKYPHFFLTLPLPKKTSKTGICNYISTLGENSAPRCVRSNKKINDFIINKVCTNLVKKTFSLKVKLELYSDKQTRCICAVLLLYLPTRQSPDIVLTLSRECDDQNQLESCCGGGWWWYEDLKNADLVNKATDLDVAVPDPADSVSLLPPIRGLHPAATVQTR